MACSKMLKEIECARVNNPVSGPQGLLMRTNCTCLEQLAFRIGSNMFKHVQRPSTFEAPGQSLPRHQLPRPRLLILRSNWKRLFVRDLPRELTLKGFFGAPRCLRDPSGPRPPRSKFDKVANSSEALKFARMVTEKGRIRLQLALSNEHSRSTLTSSHGLRNHPNQDRPSCQLGKLLSKLIQRSTEGYLFAVRMF